MLAFARCCDHLLSAIFCKKFKIHLPLEIDIQCGNLQLRPKATQNIIGMKIMAIVQTKGLQWPITQKQKRAKINRVMWLWYNRKKKKYVFFDN